MTKHKNIRKNSALWQPLLPGDIVDIIAPGFGVSPSALEPVIEFVKKIGLEPRLPEDLLGPDVLCSQSDKIRFKHLKNAIYSKDSKAIWCVRAGYGAIRIIDEVAKLKKPARNKVFIGYSDAVTIHNFLNQFWRLPSLHGPLLDRLGQHTLPLEQVDELLDVLFGRRECVEFKNLMPLNKVAQKKSKIKSTVVGGNLTVVHSVLGTKFMRPPKNQILFFEDTGERGYRVDRMLKQLEMSGYFTNTKAIIFGEFTGGNEPSGENKISAVIERFAQNIKIPVFTDLPVGHGDMQRPVPLMTTAILETGGRGRLQISTGADLP